MRKIYEIIFRLVYILKINTLLKWITKQDDVIIMYHEIYDKESFKEQMDYLKDNYEVISLEEYVKKLKLNKVKEKNERSNLVITFDDGHKSTYSIAYPILKELNIKASIFVVPNFLPDKEYMSIDEVVEVSNNNIFEIGAHTMNHRDLGKCSLNEIEYEIKEAKYFLEKILNKNITTFAYPFGKKHNYNEYAIKILKEYDFICSVTTERGLNISKDYYELNRIGVSDCDTMPVFISKLERYYPYKITLILGNFFENIKRLLK